MGLEQTCATKDLNDIFPYFLHFYENLKHFGTGDFCVHLFCGCKFCKNWRSESRALLRGSETIYNILTFRIAFALNVLCRIMIDGRTWFRDINGLSFV
jgi:hypothetical protein